MPIVGLEPGHHDAAARILVEAFRENWPHAWPTMGSAVQEVEAATHAAVALEGDEVTGWIGAVPGYGGRVWEVHPLAVAPSHRGRGIGRRLLENLEGRAAEAGALTLLVGTDDESDMTSLSGVDLYPDPLAHLADIRDLRGHPFGFYLRCGFSLAGVVPDANGPGKPDILLAKRVTLPSGQPGAAPPLE